MGVSSPTHSDAALASAALHAHEMAQPSRNLPTTVPNQGGSEASGASRLSASTSKALGLRRAASREALAAPQKKDKPPPHLGQDAKWDWKIKQLSYFTALKGVKKMGRERCTAICYADEAEAAGKGTVGGAIRVRCRRHEVCENLAYGGFATRDAKLLHEELTDLTKVVEEWPANAEEALLKRSVKEDAATPDWISFNWNAFHDRVQTYPSPVDPPDAKFTLSTRRCATCTRPWRARLGCT